MFSIRAVVEDIRQAGGTASACIGSVTEDGFADLSCSAGSTFIVNDAGHTWTGAVRTPGRGGTPDEAAGAVFPLCGPEANDIAGHVLMVTSGF